MPVADFARRGAMPAAMVLPMLTARPADPRMERRPFFRILPGTFSR
jgi:hypothetical protein